MAERLRLSQEQRRRLLRRDYAPLHFDDEPKVDLGDIYVLNWAPVQRSHDGDGNIAIVPALPLRWITVSAKVRRRAGGWSVRFDVTDRRTERRLIRRTPLAFDAEVMRRDHIHPPTTAEIEQARIQGAYTSSRRDAIDHLESVDDLALARFRKERDQRYASVLEREIAAFEEVCNDLETWAETSPDARKAIGAELWAARGRLNAAKAKLRRMAA